MPKYTLAATVLFILFTGCRPTQDDYRRDFVKGCVNRYAKDSTVANTKGRVFVEEYCNCMGDQLNAKMNADQWRTFNKTGDTTLSKYRENLVPCTEDFQKKLSSIKHDSALN